MNPKQQSPTSCCGDLVLNPDKADPVAQQAGAGRSIPPPRPKGPCDVYAAAGAPCAAAHSTTRALYAAYNGPLYQVLRQSDGKTLDIGVVQPSAGDAGGYAVRPSARDRLNVSVVMFGPNAISSGERALKKSANAARPPLTVSSVRRLVKNAPCELEFEVR